MSTSTTPARAHRLDTEALIRARGAKHLSQQDAADRAGIARRTLQSAESGERVPHAEHLAALAAVYGIPLDSLFTTSNTERRSGGTSPNDPAPAPAHGG